MIDFNEILAVESDSSLRDYQAQAKREIYEKWKNSQSILLQMPTGTGKTRVFTSIVKDIHNYSIKRKQAYKVLILVHREELVNQASESLGRRYNIAHGIIKSKYFPQKFYPTQIASVQTLVKRLKLWADKNFDVIVIDEAHHSVAQSYTDIIHTYPNAKILGVTATPYRLSGQGFNKLYEGFIQSKSVSEFIRMGHLSAYKYFSVRPNSFIHRNIISIDKFDVNGDYASSSMLDIMTMKKVRSSIIKSYNDFARGMKGIVYTINKAHNIQVCQDYIDNGVKAAAIDSDTDSEKRRVIVQDFIAGRVEVLCNVNIFTEGFDCPDIQFIQLARPTKSLGLYFQQVGRGLRTHQEKDSVIFIDNVGLYNDFGLPSNNINWIEYYFGNNTAESSNNSEQTEGVSFSFIEEIEEGDEEVIIIEDQNKSESGRESTFEYFLINAYSDFLRPPIDYADIIEHYRENIENEDQEIIDEFYSDYTRVANINLLERNSKYNLKESKTDKFILKEWCDVISKPNGFGILKFILDGKEGLFDLTKRKITVKCEYTELEPLYYARRPHSYIALKDGMYGILEDNGKIAVPIEYNDIWPSDTFYNVYLGDSEEWRVYEVEQGGIVDEYDSFKEESEFGIVEYKSLKGIWSYSYNKLIHPVIYSSVEKVENYYIVGLQTYGFFRRSLFGVFDIKLNEIIPFRYENITLYNEKYFKYQGSLEEDGIQYFGFGLFDLNGESVLKPKYQEVTIYENYFVVRFDNEWKVLNFELKEITSNQKRAVAIGLLNELLQEEKQKRKRPRIKPKN